MRALLKSILLWLNPSLLQAIRSRQYKKILPKHFVAHIGKLNRNSVVIDVGANVGLVSELLARTGARVFAFEPNKRAINELRRVATRYPNIEVFEVAAGIKDEMTQLYLHKDSGNTNEDLTQASSLKSEKPNVSKDLAQDVKEIDFAKFLLNLNTRVDLIKIDIEGYEIELINHLLDKFALNNVDKIYVETHERKFSALIEATEKMKCRIRDSGLGEKLFFDWH